MGNSSFATHFRKRAGNAAVNSFFTGLSRLSAATPQARRALSELTILKNVPYGIDRGGHCHLLDIYLPPEADTPPPVMFYVHGGGFRMLSKDTHWLMGVAFARLGFAVFNVNYRLAPEHPFPAAIEDVFDAWRWVHDHAADYGADPSTIVVSGESAGANLATSLTLATTYERPEPFARQVYELGRTPDAVIASCGLLQVSDCERFSRRRKLPAWLGDRISEVAEPYLVGEFDEALMDFADPVRALERLVPPSRELPPFFAFAGTRDPVLDDTRRLKAALDDLGVHCETRYYPGEVHAFHAFVWRAQARECWNHQYDFLREHVLGST